MSILMLSSDLMFTSRAKGAADALGLALRTVSDSTAAGAVCREEQVRLVVVDLESAGDVAPLLAELKSLAGDRPTVLAYGPHVQEGRLQAAQEAGCDLALTRGEFNSQMSQWFEKLAK